MSIGSEPGHRIDAQLDDFKVTPQSQKAFNDLKVTSGLGPLVKDERTRAASVQVVANNGWSLSPEKPVRRSG